MAHEAHVAGEEATGEQQERGQVMWAWTRGRAWSEGEM